MRRSKEIVILATLLVGAMVFVLWYVIDRRAKNRALPPAATRNLAPEPPPATPVASGPAPVVVPSPVDLTQHEGSTIDFSTGQAVVKTSPEDKAALDAALRDIADATKDVTFGPADKPAEPAKP
jgi:hypothetical protein